MKVEKLTKFLFFALLLLLLRSIFAYSRDSGMSDVDERYEIEIGNSSLFACVLFLYYFCLLFDELPLLNLFTQYIIRTVDSVSDSFLFEFFQLNPSSISLLLVLC